MAWDWAIATEIGCDSEGHWLLPSINVETIIWIAIAEAASLRIKTETSEIGWINECITQTEYWAYQEVIRAKDLIMFAEDWKAHCREGRV